MLWEASVLDPNEVCTRAPTVDSPIYISTRAFVFMG